MKPTIFALSTPPGKGGVGVIRISGPGAGAALALFGVGPVAPRYATRAVLVAPQSGLEIDDALVLFFPGPRSFTGEDVLELHIHSGAAIVDAVLAALGSLPECRLAEPGEFTRRAFENDKIDLTEAEGLADLIEAETEAQRVQALRQLKGGLGDLYRDWLSRLADALALVEANLDFSDEEDVAAMTDGLWRGDIQALAGEMARHLDDAGKGERVRDGVRVAIVGAPNVGKSSLLNALARRDAAIVSAIAGTTRDRVDVHLDLGGYAVLISDTAGVRETGDEIEREGIRRTRLAADDADVVLRVGDLTAPGDLNAVYDADARCIDVWNKADLGDGGQGEALTVSATSGANLDGLEGVLTDRVAALCAGGESGAISRERHRRLVEEARLAVDAACIGMESVLVAEELRRAVFCLGRIVGKVDVEDVLDRIFSGFCIGK